ncbi:lipopolysaccharide biosynthesis protein [Algoriphagus sp.]|uniref:lipopolysaccharide biosynthesis protein n=1 Tax=Algoriphagus sp. TaxID=1872435 RepID=UPI003F72D36E
MSSKPVAVHRIFSGSVWGILAKILDAAAKFVTIPLLVGYYGKADYGLIALAFSLNAYLRLMDLGMNVGSVRFFSRWEATSDWENIGKASRSSVIFYGTIGLINALIFVFMANYGQLVFNLKPDQIPTYRIMMYILSASTVLNWLSNVIIQLLSAKDELGYVNRVTVVSSVLNFVVAILAIHFQWSLPLYFLFYTISTLIPIPLNVFRLRVYPIPIGQLLMPKWDGKIFREIIGYSSAIFLMGLFQLTANELRPILLAKFASGIDVLTDYRVIQTIAMLIISFGTIFLQVLLPSASKVYQEGNHVKMEKMVFAATRYISIFLSFIVFLLVLNSESILLLYMGKDYLHLSVWMNLWLLTVLLNMHNTPVASLVLSSGKTRFLIYSSATACILSLPITVVLAPTWNVGAAVIGYLAYMLIQIGFFYVYYIPRVLMLDSKKIFFGAFSPSVLGAIVAFAIAYGVGMWIELPEGIAGMIIRSAIFTTVFAAFHFLFIIKSADIEFLRTKLLKRKPSNEQE